MIYVVSFMVVIFSMFLSYVLLKVKISYYLKILINIFMLIISGVVIVMTGFKEDSFLIYSVLLVYTVAGIITHILAPIF